MENNKATMPSYDDSYIIKFGLAIILVVFVIIGGWMAFAPLASSSVAIGKVSADSDKKTIQHLEGGKVDAIYVKDGDKVKKDQLLIKLSDVQIKAQLDILKSQYQDAMAQFARLKAQRDGDKSIVFPSALKDKNAINNQRNIFDENNRAFEDEEIINTNRILQAKNQINGLNAIILSKENRLLSLSEEAAEWESLYKQRLVDKQRIRDIEREKNAIEGEIASNQSEIARLNEQIVEIQTQHTLRKKEFNKETLQKYVETKSLLSDLKSKIIANEDTLQRTNITAPIDGTVVGLEMHTVGGVIAPGNPILGIVPEGSKLLVVAQVPTTDIDKVKIGLLADIRFTAFDLKQTHVIEGEIIHVSADSFMDEATGVPYYEAKIEVTPEGIVILDENNFILVSGMPAEVMIKIGDRTVLSYLVKPFTDMLSRSLNEE